MPIRNHFIPEYYLKNYCDNNGKIWVFDRDKNQKIQTGVHAIGCEKDLYSNAMEKGLAENIEYPMNEVFRALINLNKITDEQKFRFCEYICIFHKRTVAFMEHTQKIKEQILNSDQSILDLQKKFSISRDEAISVNQKIIDDRKTVWEVLMEPSSTPSIVEALYRMTWSVYFTDRPSFITSDKPFFFPEKIGLAGSPFSEFSFPISSNTLLVGTWGKDELFFHKATDEIVNEGNTRMRRIFHRYLFSFENYHWLKPIRFKENYKKFSRVTGLHDTLPGYSIVNLKFYANMN